MKPHRITCKSGARKSKTNHPTQKAGIWGLRLSSASVSKCRPKLKPAVPGSNDLTERGNRRPTHPPKALPSVRAQGALQVLKVSVAPSTHKAPPFLQFFSNATSTWNSADHWPKPGDRA